MSWDFPFRGESQAIDQSVRAKADGSFVQVSGGCTHYEIGGPQAGKCVVLVHGFSVPYFIWDPTFEELAAAGLRVLRYDLFGRGYSDRPRARYDIEFFVAQLRDLLERLNIQRTDLIGLSMGGAIAAAFTARFPSLIRKLVLIDPIGTDPMPLSAMYRLVLLPGVGEIVLGLFGTAHMIRNAATDFFDPKEVTFFQERYALQMRYRGFKRAILSTLRHHMIDGFPAVYARLGELDTPLLLIWGRNDRTLPLSQSRGILERVPRAEFQIVEDCGHIPHFERPEIVNPLLLEYLDSE